MKVLISQRAEDDLARIYSYIATHNPDVAERFKTEAERALTLLANIRAGAAPGWETRHTMLRFWVISRFHNYLIYYEPRETGVSLNECSDGRRDVRRIMEEGVEDPKS